MDHHHCTVFSPQTDRMLRAGRGYSNCDNGETPCLQRFLYVQFATASKRTRAGIIIPFLGMRLTHHLNTSPVILALLFQCLSCETCKRSFIDLYSTSEYINIIPHPPIVSCCFPLIDCLMPVFGGAFVLDKKHQLTAGTCF